MDRAMRAARYLLGLFGAGLTEVGSMMSGYAVRIAAEREEPPEPRWTTWDVRELLETEND